METLVPRLKEYGYNVIARWVFGNEEGLIDEEICKLDLDDIKEASVTIVFTHPREEPQPGGGRFVEMGYSLALGKDVIVIGPRENVFCNHPSIQRFDDLDAFFKWHDEL